MTGEMEMAVMRCSAREATAEAVLCSAALPGSAARIFIMNFDIFVIVVVFVTSA